MSDEHAKFVSEMLQRAKKRYDDPQEHVHLQPDPDPEIEPQKQMDPDEIEAVRSYAQDLQRKIQKQ